MNSLQSAAHEMLQLLIHKAAYSGKTTKMTMQIPYEHLMDHPDMKYENVNLEITIITEWNEGDEEDE